MKLKGTNVIITGSTGRVGSQIAMTLAENGCNCICHYNKNRQKAEQLVQQIEDKGRKAVSVGADLTEPEQIENLFSRADKFGVPRILINSAAVFVRQPLDRVTFEQAQKVLNVNLIAPILASRAFAEIIRGEFASEEAVVGKIINVSDVGGIRPWGEYVLYCSSKAGLIGATKALAKELAPRITVNSVAPGMVTWPDDFDESKRKDQLKLIPAGRIGEPKEVADVIIFLLENDYITGQVLNVDGGRCI